MLKISLPIGKDKPKLPPNIIIKDLPMEDEILKVISKHTPFSISSVKYAYDILKSYDALIKACDLSCEFGKSLEEIAGMIAYKK